MYMDDWNHQATRSLWYMMQEEHPQTLQSILGSDNPTLTVAAERLHKWIENERIHIPRFPDRSFVLAWELLSYALDEVDWKTLAHRIALALNIRVCNVPYSHVCYKCHQLICQLCMLCVNPSCENAHAVDCLSESPYYDLGAAFFDFTDRKLVLKVGETQVPIDPEEYKRFYTWLDIRKNG